MNDPTRQALKSPTLTYQAKPTTPTIKLPPLACDAHVHVFGPAARFPYAPGRKFTPVDAPKETLFALHRQLGIERCVIVQSVLHGFDNWVVEDAIQAGAGRYLGVALVPVNVADSELRRLASSGFRAVRFNFMRHLENTASIEQVVALTTRLKAAGLHLQVHFESTLVHTLAVPLARSAVPVVIDHMGRVNASLGAADADFAALHALLRNPLFYVKVSGIDRIDPTFDGVPPYAQGVALARLLVESFPDRCLWGSDWPHPNHNHIPDDGVLVDALARIAPEPEQLEQLLVHNPQRLFRFGE